MTYQLRPYQSDLLDRVSQSWDSGKRSIMLQLATGGGKTICFAHLVQTFIANEKTVLVLAHREELIRQAADKITAMTGIEPGITKARYKPDYSKPIQVASVQSLTHRLSNCPQFDLVVIDEAHHSIATSYRAILSNFPNSQVLGVSATPIRLTGEGFRGLFGLLQDTCKNLQDDPQSIMQKQFEDLCFLLNLAIPNVLTLQSFQINDYSD